MVGNWDVVARWCLVCVLCVLDKDSHRFCLIFVVQGSKQKLLTFVR